MRHIWVFAFAALALPAMRLAGAAARTGRRTGRVRSGLFAASLRRHTTPAAIFLRRSPARPNPTSHRGLQKQHTGITFVNRSDEPVKIYWLSFQGERKLYQYLPPGGRHTQPTFIGHYWLVASLTEQCIGIFKGAPQSIAFF